MNLKSFSSTFDTARPIILIGILVNRKCNPGNPGGAADRQVPASSLRHRRCRHPVFDIRSAALRVCTSGQKPT